MNHRLLDFAEAPAFLSVDNGLLTVRQDNQVRERIPVADIAAVIASHRQVVFTQHALAALGQAGAIVVSCDERHHPASMLLPLEAHFAQSERFRAQAEAGAPVKKRIWQELVRAKIAAQSATLLRLHGADAGLGEMAGRVRSGDAGNAEATAAVRYWPRLFGDPAFRRGNEADGRNALLNYGYGIVRAICARAICGAGLHPSLGVSHSNRYNAFCLADDLMEPLRPIVDFHIATWCLEEPQDCWQVNKTTKQVVLGALASRYEVAGESRALFDIAARRAQMLAAVLTGSAARFAWEPVTLP
jgi:CRISPR-associated protein Cas1